MSVVHRLLRLKPAPKEKVAPKPDQISADVAVAASRNEQASLRARAVLAELLNANESPSVSLKR